MSFFFLYIMVHNGENYGMCVILGIVCVVIVYMLWYVLRSILPRSEGECKVYQYERLACVRRGFRDRYIGVWRGDKYDLVTLCNGEIGVCMHGELLFLIKLVANNKLGFFVNKNVAIYDDDIRVSGEYIEIKHTEMYAMEIRFIKGNHKVDMSKGLLNIHDFGMYLELGSISDVVVNDRCLEIKLAKGNAKLKFDERFENVGRVVAQDYARRYFGVFDKDNEITVIPDLSNKTRKRLEYIGAKVDRSCRSICDVKEFERYRQICINKLHGIIDNECIKINLTQMGIGEIHNVIVDKNNICVADLYTGYKIKFVLNAKILSCQKYCYWGQNYLLLSVNKVCNYEFWPFGIRMDDEFENGWRIQNNGRESMYLNALDEVGVECLSFSRNIEYLNRNALLGRYQNVEKILKMLNIDKMDDGLKFQIANLILSVVRVSQDREVWLDECRLSLVMEQCKGLANKSRGQSRCFLEKLRDILCHSDMVAVIQKLLDEMGKDCDIFDWESVFRYVLGIKLIKNKLFVEKSRVKYDVSINVYNSVLRMQNCGSEGILRCNDRWLVGLDYVSLSVDDEQNLNVQI
ncbi:MAG: hypothetical protein IKC79_03020 [Clostridia bacterium]|nr:hypothetical protein [Clostridia bacterium]